MLRHAHLRCGFLAVGMVGLMMGLAQPAMAFEGPYIGASLGFGSMTMDNNVSALAPPPALQPLTSETGAADISTISGVISAGWNFRLSQRTLVGIEGDYAFLDGNDRLGNAHRVSFNHLFTLRARLGYVIHNRWMLYATAGLATATLEFEGTTDPTQARFKTDTSRTGWVVGGGAEYEPNRIINLRAEVLYVDLGDWQFDTATARHHADTAGVQFRLGVVVPIY